MNKNIAKQNFLSLSHFVFCYEVKLPARFYSGGKVYVDPKTYPDVDDAVTEFAFEIPQDELKLAEKIGDGEFADVYKGTLFRGSKDYQVAVKMLKVMFVCFYCSYCIVSANKKPKIRVDKNFTNFWPNLWRLICEDETINYSKILAF